MQLAGGKQITSHHLSERWRQQKEGEEEEEGGEAEVSTRRGSDREGKNV